MKDLIVDFPSRCSASTKKVQFSKTSSIKFIKRINEMTDTRATWYLSKDCKAMRVETKTAVRHANKALLALYSSDQDFVDNVGQDGIILTGIESIVTPNMIKKTRASRYKYINAVLNEQET